MDHFGSLSGGKAVKKHSKNKNEEVFCLHPCKSVGIIKVASLGKANPTLDF